MDCLVRVGSLADKGKYGGEGEIWKEILHTGKKILRKKSTE